MVRQPARRIVGGGLDDSEDDDERQDRRARGEVDVLLGDRRKDGPFEAHHAAHESVHQDQQRELAEVVEEAQPDNRRGVPRQRVAMAHARPWLNLRMACMSCGCVRRALASFSTKAARSAVSIGFHCFSKARVELGFPLRPAPQAEPAKWPG